LRISSFGSTHLDWAGTEPYDRQFLDAANAAAQANHELVYYETLLQPKTASLADGFPAVCVFVNDDVGSETLKILSAQGTKLIALRCTGFNNVDLPTAAELGIKVVRVTVYSPYSVAEFVVGMIQLLIRYHFPALSPNARELSFD
jgi:D-lactate dehydrogenase